MFVNNISVIIPTLNAGTMIDDLLSALKRQTITPAEIIVVDSSSDDDTQAIVRAKHPDVRLLVIDRKELEKMNGKRVLVVDDVISTGGSLKALDALAEKTQCTIVGQAAVLAEGDASERKDIIFLEPLPLFFH